MGSLDAFSVLLEFLNKCCLLLTHLDILRTSSGFGRSRFVKYFVCHIV